MLANFKKLMSNKENENIYIPKELIDVFNKKLPNGLEYVQYKPGACRIMPNRESTSTSISMNVTIPDSAKKYKGIIKTTEDLAEYAYRTQQTLDLTPYEDNTIMINGQRIKLSDLVKYPFDSKNSVEWSDFKMIPPAFPNIDPISLKAGSVSLTFHAERKPYDSMSEIFIQLEYEDLILLEIILNEESLKSNITIHMKAQTSSAEEMLKVYKFYNGFLDGNVTYKNTPLGQKPDKQYSTKIDDDIIIALEKMVKLEYCLGIKFNVPQKMLYGDVEILERLYVCFIEGNPVKRYAEINEINSIGTFDANEKDIINKEVSFTYLFNQSIQIFGVNFNIYVLRGMFNISVESIEHLEDNKVHMKIKSASNTKSYYSDMYFMSENYAKEYQQNNNSWLEILKNAKEINYPFL